MWFLQVGAEMTKKGFMDDEKELEVTVEEELSFS